MPKHTHIRIIYLLTLTFMIILATLPLCPICKEPGESQLLLKFKPGVAEGSKLMTLTSLGLRVVDEISQIQVLVVSVPQDSLPHVKSVLSRSPLIDLVEENSQIPFEAVPNDPYYSFQWHLKKIQAPGAWDISTGNKDVVVAVLDSGIDRNHPELSAQTLSGWNFYDNNNDITDLTGHGTAVAGVAAAMTNNSLGVAAVMWRSSILPVRVTDPQGYTSYSLLSQGLIYAADRGAKVATISFGIYAGHTLASSAKYFMQKGGLVFSAAGNAEQFVDQTDNPYIIAVSGTTSSDLHFGSYGPFVDVAAPSSAIYTTLKGGGYGNVGGTSFSCPLAAGLAALIFSANPSLTPPQVEEIIESTAVDLGDPGYDAYYGWGRIDASEALRRAAGTTPVKDTTPPAVSITSPPDGSTVSRGITVSVNANDDNAVSKVELYRNGTLLAADLEQPWEFYWDTSSDSNGLHKLVAKAYDTSNNVGESDPVAVNVANTADNTADKTLPTVSIDYPLDGVKVSGFVDISASATDDSGISRVEFYIDGRLKSTVYAMPYLCRWNTKSTKDGWRTISVKAYDSSGNSVEASVVVYVSNRK